MCLIDSVGLHAAVGPLDSWVARLAAGPPIGRATCTTPSGGLAGLGAAGREGGDERTWRQPSFNALFNRSLQGFANHLLQPAQHQLSLLVRPSFAP